MLCRICIAQIQPWKPVLDRAGCTAPTRQHELWIIQIIQIIQIRNLSALNDLDHDLWGSIMCLMCGILAPISQPSLPATGFCAPAAENDCNFFQLYAPIHCPILAGSARAGVSNIR